MQSRSGVTNYKTVSLDRAARLTGEAFGYEDAAGVPAPAQGGGRIVWTAIALVALCGLAYIALR